MKAFAVPAAGQPPALVEIPLPEPTEREVRVRVTAASLNGFDVAVAAGYLVGRMEHRYPVVIGKDFAGVVDAVGSGVSDFSVGDRVFGVVLKPYLGDGSLSEYVTVGVDAGLAKTPEGVEDAVAAGLGLAGSTAIAAFDAVPLTADSTVLVVGATGGVGMTLVALAASAGARVIATGRTEQGRQALRERGAADTIDYTEGVVPAVRALVPQGVDVAYHLAGDPLEIAETIRDNGAMVSSLGASVPNERIRAVPISGNATHDVLDRVAENQVTGLAPVQVQRQYPLAEAGQALSDFANGTVGKLVITVPTAE
jgi:NADPH:quinone reductase-like Zn-dependent oxidoreductase